MSTQSNEIIQINADKIASITGFRAEEIAIIKKTVAKNTSDTELAFFLTTAKSVNLNPLNKEIWCYKNTKDDVLVFAGRDGFLKRAQESPLWNGMTSSTVHENDEFNIEITEKEIKISHKPNFKDRGNVLGAYAIVKPKNAEYATVEWAEFKIYNKGWNIWKTDPDAMIIKVAETHALKKAFGITILQSEYDYEIKEDVAQTLIHKSEDEIDVVKKRIIDALDVYKGADKENIKKTCQDAIKVDVFDLDFAKKVAQRIGLQL